ncbi:BPI fold-containing family B member 3-like [Erythrolamprus reginae]|uniref:BPI fold-containing family B member 3-like n=1 Tax=Erythrolamprus reginae TaxID=121349 RepID=UPI00396CA30C
METISVLEVNGGCVEEKEEEEKEEKVKVKEKEEKKDCEILEVQMRSIISSRSMGRISLGYERFARRQSSSESTKDAIYVAQSKYLVGKSGIIRCGHVTMWKILGLVLFGTLVNISEGKKPGIISMLNFPKYQTVVDRQLKVDGILHRLLKKTALADIPFPGALGLLKINKLNVADVEITPHKLIYVPGLRGAEVISGIRVSIGGSLLGGITSGIKITIEFQSRIKFEIVDYNANTGHVSLTFRECNILFGDVSIEILSLNLTPTALTSIKNSIMGNINRQICKFLTDSINGVSDRFLDTMNVVLPFEPFGSLRCLMASLPEISNNTIWLRVFVDFDIKGQGLLSVPDSAPDIILPPLDKYGHCQCLHAAVLNLYLSVVLRIEPREYSCTPNVFSGADELRAAILALIPSPPPSLSSGILYFRISLLASPVIQFGKDIASVEISVQIEFFVKNQDGSTTSVVILKESLILSATFSVTKGYLYASLSISSHKTALISSALGITDVSSLEPLCGKLLGEIFLVSLNAYLKVGLPLPPILTAVLDNPSVLFIENGLLLCI